MQDKISRDRIISLINKEVVPAIGCTEPMAVALATARATEALGSRPAKITALLSANILKNAMGVGIPGTGMIGLPIAIALGALIGKSEYQLEVLRDLTPQTLEEGKQYIAEKRIDIKLKEDITEKLYVEIICNDEEGRESKAIISGGHTHFVFVSSPSATLLDLKSGTTSNTEEDDIQLCMRMVYDFATTAPLDEISFILKTKEYNMNAARKAILGNYGHNLGKTIDRPLAQGIFGKSIFSHIIARTASACDARMGGALIPVMSNSGSGNQGICATNPVAVYAKENENTEEELIRALTLSHLTAIYIKQSLGKLSALCGCVVASIGSSCGITYLMGGDYQRICNSVKNMIANLTGMICDGAKPSCALKISSGVSTAILSALLSMEGKCVSSAEGIIDDDVDRSIHNLTSIGADAMRNTDDMVLNIMTHKGQC
ncbi:MAG: L-serine ammonia-lyase, iron-sulfur-dependent, subunit alpha [Prevotellaceae bacterium]|nr:L-serine ammonia-lyase, iron-sulfur-dependent, subunit alpha [Prevotellaceae bacterium]MDD5992196.1 L-serine ammonia-lyase, iron-sulfur-dependent, subunit alpha [Prevotellaceae bacterium]MDD6009765.1 L-serine ammonia-lyase, iron-sulfur-dependent, subunit alpha [Prevotellaceae bacterium]MDD6111465.1 L-serine ammonia-lyase, iron-sulfur-dependent, subunit alpha [Prevotellaceae bacterium]MDD6781256.1 L-serine ammonia-lyase, iron-sulfur-dependent, subunit alpha [Prevotellaceae bacterium]